MVSTEWTKDNAKINEKREMNSQELQTNFSSVYKSFFNMHDIVLSWPSVLTWWADISHGISALRIKQKLPIKTFCAVNFNTSWEVKFWKIFHYSIVENEFKEDNVSIFFKNDTARISLFLKDFLVKNGCSSGIDIDFLSEAPRGHGFAFTGVVSVLLTFLIHVIIEKLDKDILTTRELSLIDEVLFDELYSFSLELSACISEGKSIGSASNYTVMLPDNALPIVYLSEGSSPTHMSDRLIRKDTLPDFLWIERSATVRELPLDYGVIFTGIEYNFSELERAREQISKENERLDVFIANTIVSLEKEKIHWVNLSNILGSHNHQASYNNIDNTNLRILEWFDYLFKNSHDDQVENIFINTIKNIGLISFSGQKENKLFFALKYFFGKYKQFEDEELGIIPFNTGKIGGSLLFVMKSGKSRETMQKVLAKLRSEWHIAFLDYASWRDGYSSKGVYLEQYIGKDIYSPYTKEGNVQFTDTLGKSYFGDYESIVNNEKDCILLDTIGGRVYISGKKLTSKDIHSQATTIDIMKILIQNMGKEISNSLLPASSYSHNKNEIMGKIVTPFRKLTKTYFWKELPLSCTGWVADYYLRLEHDDSIRIGTITKMQY